MAELWNTVYGYFARWQQEGVFAQLNGLLRQLLRQKEGREAEPSACVIDAQSVKTYPSVLATSQGIDAGKKIVGRKRSIVTDTIGLLLAVLVTAASVQDSVAGTQLLDQVAAEHRSIRKAWVDGGYRQHLVEHAANFVSALADRLFQADGQREAGLGKRSRTGTRFSASPHGNVTPVSSSETVHRRC